MKKKLLALISSFALGLPMFAAFYMCVKLTNGDTIKYDVDDVDDVEYSDLDSVPSVKISYMKVIQKNGDTLMYNTAHVVNVSYEYHNDSTIVDTTIIDTAKTPFEFKIQTSTTVELSSCNKDFFIDEDGIITEKNVVIPSKVEIDGIIYNVASIGNAAFALCSGLKSIEIPSTVTSIGDSAFYSCKGLANIEIPSSVTSIGEEAFQSCTALTNLTIPSSVTTIADWAFYGCVNLDIIVDNSKENIDLGIDVFEICKSVKYTKEDTIINNPEPVLKYRILADNTAEVISGCADTIIIPDTVEIDGNLHIVTSIGNTAFIDCPNLQVVVLPEFLTTIKDSAFWGCDSLRYIDIPEYVNSIGAWAFYSCEDLSYLSIPSFVTEIGNGAFSGCSNLNLVIDNYEDSINIGDHAFLECQSVIFTKVDTSIVIPNDTIIEDTLKPVLKYKILADNTAEVISGCADTIIIPDTVEIDGNLHIVTSIGNTAFIDCPNLQVVVLPEFLTTIKDSAFWGCDSLRYIDIPEYVNSIGAWAFYSCENLSYLSIPSFVTEIGDGAFSGCSNLDLVIDNYIDSIKIGEHAFSGCKSVTFTKIDPSIVDATTSPMKFKVLSDTTAEVTVSDKSKIYGTIEIPSKVRIDGKVYVVTRIGDSAFEKCTVLTNVKIPSTVYEIGNLAFGFCTGLSSVEIPESVTVIGDEAFTDCTNMRNLEIPTSVISFGVSAFAYCKNLNLSINNIEENLTIGINAFYGCKSVKYAE